MCVPVRPLSKFTTNTWNERPFNHGQTLYKFSDEAEANERQTDYWYADEFNGNEKILQSFRLHMNLPSWQSCRKI